MAVVVVALAAAPAGAQRGSAPSLVLPGVTRPSPWDQRLTLAPSRACTQEKLDEVREEATPGASEVAVDCNLRLEAQDVITKAITLKGASASGVTIDCQGATLDGSPGTVNAENHMIRIKAYGELDRPEDITIRNCNVIGSVSISPASGLSDKSPDYVTTVRANAPRRITFQNLTLTAVGRDAFYVNSGVTEVSLLNSELKGWSKGVPIYLDAESSGTVIKNSYIHVDTTEREQIAIDGSDYNQVINNWFEELDDGGIYLYRNCGEAGTIRHTTPSHNVIVNNVFYYNRYTGGNPSVYVGSRNGRTRKGTKDYCDLDAGYPFGSSVDDRDFATHNVVMQNQIFKRPVSEMIKSKDWSNNSPNLIGYNETVTTASWPRPPAGCYVPGGYKEFILHGETTDRFAASNGAPVCDQATCVDGSIVASPALDLEAALRAARDRGLRTGVDLSGPTTLLGGGSVVVDRRGICDVRRVPFDCRVSGDNDGCHQTVYCPSGTRVVGAVAACNLEYGAVSDGMLATVPPNLIHVVKPSDSVSSGGCYVGNNGVSIAQAPIRGIAGLTRVSVGCQEHDRNGGDCDIRGSLYCRP